MRAMVLSHTAPIDSSPLVEQDIPIPEPKAGEIRMRVKTCGVCRTDLHVTEGELPPIRPHIVPGHQVVGLVDKCGPETKRFRIGQRIGIAWLRWTDGKCRYCRAGKENLCPNAKFTGYTEDGGYAQYAVAPEDFAYELPDELDDVAVAPLLCSGIIGFHALKRANVQPGCALGLYGFGSSASLSIQVARHWGCRVYVMTRDAKHQALARELGATWAGGSADKPPELLQSAVLFAPVGSLVPTVMESLDMGGTLAIAGIYLTDIPPLNYQKHLFHEKTLCSVTANTRKDGEELLRISAEMRIQPKTTTYPLRDANRALQELKHDGISGSGVLAVE
ncbi:MAG: zinc-dependent alcohol dehydrogenase family protein [Tepidisphaeraceae bacterium]|jgi:propanol-preferring alcohol dehydrogenase